MVSLRAPFLVSVWLNGRGNTELKGTMLFKAVILKLLKNINLLILNYLYAAHLLIFLPYSPTEIKQLKL